MEKYPELKIDEYHQSLFDSENRDLPRCFSGVEYDSDGSATQINDDDVGRSDVDSESSDEESVSNFNEDEEDDQDDQDEYYSRDDAHYRYLDNDSDDDMVLKLNQIGDDESISSYGSSDDDFN